MGYINILLVVFEVCRGAKALLFWPQEKREVIQMIFEALRKGEAKVQIQWP